jgi:23S rRNA (guanosine2251-2'-O)-methyltransferase
MRKSGSRSQRWQAGPRAADNNDVRWLHGVHVVGEWLRAQPQLVRSVRFDARAGGEVAQLVELARRAGVAVNAAREDEIEKLAASKRHQGVAAECAPFPYTELDDVVARGSKLLLVVDQIQDPHNLGALIRTAEAVGAGGLVAPKDGTVGVTPVAESAAAGAAAWLPIARVTNLVRALSELKQAGYWIVGLMPRGATDIFAFDPPDRIALLLGGEAGVRQLVGRQTDFSVTIPMAGHAESLNASVAGAIAMYTLTQRQASQSSA